MDKTFDSRNGLQFMTQQEADRNIAEAMSYIRKIVNNRYRLALVAYNLEDPNDNMAMTNDVSVTTPELARQIITAMESLEKQYVKPRAVVLMPKAPPGN